MLHAQRTRLENSVVEWRPNSWQADTVFLKRRGIQCAVLSCVETTSRLAWCHSYNSAHPTSAKTVELLERMQKTRALDHLSTDPGAEFTGAEVKTYCSNHVITLHHFASADKRSKGVIESFNRTLRLLLAQWCLKHGTQNWDQESINECVHVYNHCIHSGIGFASTAE